MRPKLLDLFCGAGGCSRGYYDAGFDVVGVDCTEQDHYPFPFYKANALNFDLSGYDLIHASPPCQAYTTMNWASDNTHPDLVPRVREMLQAQGTPWIMENVIAAPIRRDFLLCGTMFNLGAHCKDGKYRELLRHRAFETSFGGDRFLRCNHQGLALGVYGGGGGQSARGYKAYADEARDAMGISWMNRREIAEAIPPAFTRYVGLAAIRVLGLEPTPLESAELRR